MSINIVDLVKGQISDQLLGQMGSVLGVEGSKTTGALSGALPGLLSGLAGSARNPSGAGALFDAISKQDDGMLGNLGNLLGGGQSAQVINQGTDVLGSLLGGGALGKLADVVGSFSGIGRSGGSSMLGMLAPLVLGVIKKQLFSGSQADAGSLASMLMGQQDNINAAMPQGFSSQLQSAGFFDSIAPDAPPVPSMDMPDGSAISNAAARVENTVDDAVGTVRTAASNAGDRVASAADGARDAVGDAGKSSGGIMRWLLPLIAIVVLGWLAMQFLGNRDVDVDVSGTVDSATTAAGDAASTATEAAGDAATAVNEAASDAASAVTDAASVDLGAAQETLSGAFSNFGSALNGISDVESAQAALPALEDVQSNLGNLTSMLDGVPAAAAGPLQEVASNGLARVQPLVDKVMAIPGVGDILSPVITPIMDMLGSIGG